jgi:hypothetical protein
LVELTEKVVPIVLASPPSLVEQDRWERQGNVMVHGFSAEPDWSIRTLQAWRRIEALPEYKAVLQAIDNEPVVASHMNTLVGAPTLAMRMEPDSLVRSILSRVLKSAGQPPIDVELFNTAYSDVVDGLASPTLERSVIAPLAGFDSDVDSLFLSPSVAIRRLTEAEIGRAIDLDLVLSPFGPGRPIFNPPTFAVEFKQVVSKRVGDQSATTEEATRMQQEADDALTSAISALRLFKAGTVDISGHFESYSLFFLRGGGSYRSSETRRYPGQPTYWVATSELEDLKSFYKSSDSSHVKRSKGLAMAIRRFGFSSDRSRADDQIVDLMIAAEALFIGSDNAAERGEQRYRMSLRAASFTPTDDWSRRELYSLYRTAYDARSTVAHGGTVEKCKLPDGTEVPLQEFVVVVQQQLRRAVRRAIEQSAASRMQFSVDWENLLLLGPTLPAAQSE